MNVDAVIDRLEQRSVDDERLQLSFDELIDLPAAERTAAERKKAEREKKLVSRPRVDPPAESISGRHQDIRLYLIVLLKTFVEMVDAGLVRDAPFQVRLADHLTYEPDIVFISNSAFDRVQETYIEGAPDIIIEVISPHSTAADRGEKFVHYEQYGVREYWLIDPIRELANVYHLGPDDLYDDTRPDTAGRLRSRVLKNFILDTNKLWGRVLPTTVETVDAVKAMVSPR